MKRTVFLVGFCLMFSSALFAQNNARNNGNSSNYNRNNKIDDDLNDRVFRSKRDNKGDDRVRVIIQHRLPPTALESNDTQKDGTRIRRELRFIRAVAAEMKLSQIEKEAGKSNVKKISIDEPVQGNATTEASFVSGASLATQTYGVTGYGIGVAIIDSGIAVHPDLTNVVKAVDFVDESRHGGYDPFGHGTHVAGIIGGNGVSSGGAHKGVATGTRLIDLRVLDRTGGGYTSDVIAAIEWAIENKSTVVNGKSLNIRVINLSLGHRPYESTEDDPLTTICRTAVRNGIVVVVSAGNFGRNSAGKPVYGSITSPGNEPSVITVGAVTTWGTPSRSDDSVATYSSLGPTAIDHHLKPDVVAPGGSLVAAMSPGSTLAVNYPQLQQEGKYLRLSGTSMAAPVVAASVALMLQANPSLKPNAIKATLLFTAEKRPGVSPLAQGAGFLNARGAVNLVKNINPNAPAGQYWLLNGGTGLNYSNVIAGFPAVWGQTIVWSDSILSGTNIFYNTIVWSDTIVWGDTIVWSDSVGGPAAVVWNENVVLDEIEAQSIVWDDVAGQTTVWED